MRKIILVSAIALLSLASCKKDRTCTCTETGNGGVNISTTTIVKSTKKTAKVNCVSTRVVDNNEVYTRDCKLS